MNEQRRQAYLDSAILESDPVKLIQILYRAALDAAGQARRHLAAGEIMARSRQLGKAGAILNELALSLNHQSGGSLSRNLVELYDYMQRLLQKANFEQVEAPLVELEGLLRTLLAAWEQVDPSEPRIPEHAVAHQGREASQQASFSYSL